MSEQNDFDSQPGLPSVAEALPKVPDPPRYAVVFYNDDYTTMEFVMKVLKSYFGKSEEQALQITMSVHKQGKGIAGIYSFEVAETKVYLVTEEARQEGYPFKCELEEVQST